MRNIFLTVFLIFLASCSPGSPNQLYRSPVDLNQQNTLLNRPLENKQGTQPAERYVTASDLPSTPIKSTKKKYKIALLVPLTGESKNLGKALLDSAQLAVFDIGDNNLTLLPYDTKSTNVGAGEAAEKAIAEGTDLILGPVFSEDAKVVAPIANRNNVNVISFSNDESLTNEGVFLLGFMPEQQVRRVVNYAKERGVKEFSAIAPKNRFGEVTVDEMISTLGSFNRPKHIEFYTSMDESMSLIINKFVTPIDEKSGLPIEDNSESENEVTEASPQSMQYDFRTGPDSERTHAILVPEGGRKASNIGARLFRHGVDSSNIRLLGTGQWDDPALEKERKLEGSWFATSSPKFWQIFEKHFKDSYNYVPVRIASLAYDGIALAAYLASEGDFSKAAITNRRGFSGVNGVFRINRDGRSERALAILEITDKGFQIVDPAPEDFNLFR